MSSSYLDKTDAFMASLGVETYRVGGSVRDELLGRRAKDADYMVRGVELWDLYNLLADAAVLYDKPSIKSLNLRDGRQYGWRVSARGLGLIEVMMPRTERPRDPEPGESLRHAFDTVVEPSLTLNEDAVRRDFTFNALYLPVGHTGGGNPRIMLGELGGVCDPTGRGLYDLSHKLIQTTHGDSFRDDPLRTLRALRFVSTLGYDLSTAAEAQMRKYADRVDGLTLSGHASGTILSELEKLLMGDEPGKALRLARDTGVLGTLLPELRPMLHFNQASRYHDLTTCEHTFSALDHASRVDAPLRVRMALLFHDAGKPEAAWTDAHGRKHFYACPDGSDFTEDHEVISERLWRAAAERLNAPKELRKDVARLIADHMVPLEGKFKASKVRRARVKYGDAMLRDLYLHRACDISGKERRINPQFLQRIQAMEEERARCEAAKVPASTKDLWIGGKDAKEVGLSGRDIGKALAAVLDDVVVQPTPQSLSEPWQRIRLSAYANG